MKIKLAKTELIHFVGIGGIGMSGLALIMKELGFKIQGSDISFNKNIERLKKNKIKVFIGHKKQNIKKSTILVISSAIRKNNLEYLEAKKKKLPIYKRGEILAHIVSLMRNIVVAGSPDGIVMIEAGANQLSEQDTIEALDFGYEAVTELIKSQEDLLLDLGIKQIKPSDPEEDKTLPSYLEKNCTKPIELVLKKFDLSKEERDLELEKIKVATQGKIDSLKDDNQLKVLHYLNV